MSTTVRPMLQSDVDQVVEVHLLAFQHFFLSMLGPAFLRELYIGILRDPSGICYVCESGHIVAGFVVGTEQPQRLYSRLLRQRWWRFGRAAARAALLHPAIVPRLLRAFTAPTANAKPAGCGLLMSLAVNPAWQGQHCGRHLVTSFLAEAENRGLGKVYLDTDTINNERTNEFYRRVGFELERSFETPEGRPMNEYSIELGRWLGKDRQPNASTR